MFRQIANRPLPSLAKNCQYAYDTMIEVLSYGIMLCQFHGMPYCNFYPNLISFTTCLFTVYLFIRFSFFRFFSFDFPLHGPTTTAIYNGSKRTNHSSFSSQQDKTTNNTTLQFANQHTDHSLVS